MITAKATGSLRKEVRKRFDSVKGRHEVTGQNERRRDLTMKGQGVSEDNALRACALKQDGENNMTGGKIRVKRVFKGRRECFKGMLAF